MFKQLLPQQRQQKQDVLETADIAAAQSSEKNFSKKSCPSLKIMQTEWVLRYLAKIWWKIQKHWWSPVSGVVSQNVCMNIGQFCRSLTISQFTNWKVERGLAVCATTLCNWQFLAVSFCSSVRQNIIWWFSHPHLDQWYEMRYSGNNRTRDW